MKNCTTLIKRNTNLLCVLRRRAIWSVFNLQIKEEKIHLNGMMLSSNDIVFNKAFYWIAAEECYREHFND